MTVPSVEVPARIRSLPVDDRGYPIPYFVMWVDGKPDFRVVDPTKVRNCVRFELCWICGQALGRYRTFAMGPAAVISATSAEPPSHRECATYAVRVCPFMVHPQAKRRESNLPPSVPIDVVPGNPGISFLWTTRNYRVSRHFVLPYDECHALEAWKGGQRATNEEAWAVYGPALRAVEQAGIERIRTKTHRPTEVISQYHTIKKASETLFTAQFGEQIGKAENTNAPASSSN